MESVPDMPMPHRSHAICLTGARSLNKRISLFVEGLLNAGLGVRVCSLPRGRWTLDRFETRASEEARSTSGSLSFSVRESSRLAVILCFHWIVLPWAVVWAVIRRVPLIYDEHDHYEINTLEGSGPWIVRHMRRWVVRAIHRIFLPHVTLVTCIHMANDELKRHLERWQDHVLELHNYPVAAWRQHGTAGRHDSRSLKFIYFGGVFEEKGVMHAADAFESLPELIRRDAQLHVFGNGDPRLIENLRSRSGVTVHDSVTPQQLRRFAENDRCCGLVLYSHHPRYGRIGTNGRKLYEYLAMGMPVIATNVGEIPAFVESHDVGIVVDSRICVPELHHAMLHFATTAGLWERQSANAYRLMESREMTWEHEWAKLLQTSVVPVLEHAA